MNEDTMTLPSSEACERNKGPILAVLQQTFAQSLHVLEIGSGTGQHAVHFARQLTHLTWHPTEQAHYLSDLAARIRLEGSANIRAPELLNVSQAVWPISQVNAVFSANTLHIMSWAEVGKFFSGASKVLLPGGTLCIYGPFRYQGRYTSESNAKFDAMLQERDPKSGLRDIDRVVELARSNGIFTAADHDLPAFNRLLVFRKEPYT